MTGIAPAVVVFKTGTLQVTSTRTLGVEVGYDCHGFRLIGLSSLVSIRCLRAVRIFCRLRKVLSRSRGDFRRDCHDEVLNGSLVVRRDCDVMGAARRWSNYLSLAATSSSRAYHTYEAPSLFAVALNSISLNMTSNLSYVGQLMILSYRLSQLS